MAGIETRHCDMYNGLVSVHCTTDTNYPGELLWEFRIRPTGERILDNSVIEWSNYHFDEHGKDYHLYRNQCKVYLPLRDMNTLRMHELKSLQLTKDGRIVLGKEQFAAVDWEKHRANYCVDIPYQAIRPPFPESTNPRIKSVRHPLITFEEAKKLIAQGMNANEGYYAFANCVIMIVKDEHRYSYSNGQLHKYRRQTAIDQNPFSNKLTIETIQEIMSLVEHMHSQIANAVQRKRPECWSWYRCVQLINHINDGNRNQETQEFMRGIVDYLDFFNYIYDEQIIRQRARYSKFYGTNAEEFHGIDKEYRKMYLEPLVFQYNCGRVMNIPLNKWEQPGERDLNWPEFKYLKASVFYVMERGRKLISRMRYHDIVHMINDKNIDLDKAYEMYIRCSHDMKKSHREKIEKRFKKINKQIKKKGKKEEAKQKKFDKHDWIGSPRISRAGRIKRIMKMMKSFVKKSLPGIIVTAVTALVAAVGSIFGKSIIGTSDTPVTEG